MKTPNESDERHYRQLLRGFFRRERFLRAWKGLVREKLQTFRTAVDDPSAWEHNDGHRYLIDVSEIRISRVEAHLATAKVYIGCIDYSLRTPEGRLDIADEFDMLIKSCASTEHLLWSLESLLHPILIARDQGDAENYDRIISVLLDEFAPGRVFGTSHDGSHIRILPIMCHKLKIDSAAGVINFDIEHEKVYYRKREPEHVGQSQETKDIGGVLCFFPSIWSFTTITLLFHEIGHTVWEHCIPAGRKRETVGLILSAFPHALPNKRVRAKLCGEVAADAFASLVGGYAFGATLCGFFLAKKDQWTRTPPGYLDIGDRVRLVQRACEFVTPNCPGRDDSYWSAIESLQRHLDETQTNTESVHRQKTSDRIIDQVIDVFATSLREIGVKLADTVNLPPVMSSDELPTTAGKTIREVLVTAAMFREKCKDDDGTEYIDWEKSSLTAISNSLSPEKGPETASG